MIYGTRARVNDRIVCLLPTVYPWMVKFGMVYSCLTNIGGISSNVYPSSEIARCRRFSVVSISLQEAAKGLQEVEETTDLARKGWELMARGG